MIISEFQDIFQKLGQVLDLYSCLHPTFIITNHLQDNHELYSLFRPWGLISNSHLHLHPTSKTKSQLKLIQVDFHVYQTNNFHKSSTFFHKQS